MDPYQLAKVIEWAGGFTSTGRMQRTVHLLQAAGCPFNLKFEGGLNGPYSLYLAKVDDALYSKHFTYKTPGESNGQWFTRISKSGHEYIEKADKSPWERHLWGAMSLVLNRHRWLLDEYDHSLNAISRIVRYRECLGPNPDVDWTDPLWARAYAFADRILP